LTGANEFLPPAARHEDRLALGAVRLCSSRRADGAGPLHLLKSGLVRQLEDEGHRVTIRPVELPATFRATEIAGTFALAAAVARGVAQAIQTGALPVVLSGNCAPAALGCVGGMKRQMHVFWSDAHGDFNTPETTTSGFLDGMALAAVTGRCLSSELQTVTALSPRPSPPMIRQRTRRAGRPGPLSARSSPWSPRSRHPQTQTRDTCVVLVRDAPGVGDDRRVLR
jgi:hypothetical protein